MYCLDDGSALLEGPASGGGNRTAILASDPDPIGEKKTKILEKDTSEGLDAKPSISFRKRRGLLVGVGLTLVIIVLGSAWAVRRYYLDPNSAGTAIQNYRTTRVTTSGRAVEADISPDGKYIVYLEMGDDGNRGLYVRQTATGTVIPIVPPVKGYVLKGTTFSRDGNFVYYQFSDRTRATSIYQVSSLGGSPRKIIDASASPVTVSPDGQRLAFLRWEGHSKGSLYTSKADGSDEKVLATLEGGEWFSEKGASWSPDGKTIAICAGIANAADKSEAYRLLGIDAGDGSKRELGPMRWANDGKVVWMPDGNSVLMMAAERPDEQGNQLWQVAYPSGTAAKVTNDVLARDDTSLGVTSDGRTIMTVTLQRRSRIESIPASGASDRPMRLTATEANMDGHDGLDVLADGRVVFASFEDGQSDIWIMNQDGSGRRKLTSDAFRDGLPTLTPDDRYIFFLSNRPDGGILPRLWRMNIDGSNVVQIAERADSSPNVLPDGQSVVYSAYGADGKMRIIRKVPIDGGEPVALTDYPTFEVSVSPDGKWVGTYFSDENATIWRYAIIPITGGPRVRHFEFPGFQYEWVRWTIDSRHLSFIGAPPDPSNIWLQPVEGGEPRKLTDFNSDYIFRHEWSRDGKILYLVRGRPSFDVVLQTAVP